MMTIGYGKPKTQARSEWPAQSVVLETLSRFISPATIQSVLIQVDRQNRRIRRLPAAAMFWLVIGIGIWSDLDIPHGGNRLDHRKRPAAGEAGP